ncbi:hypothetical protein BJ508DRAFT_419547 [Ascobolus immersus RN42]|uniref:LysM domain-containing protein n=1 Tax=Ascobolus immersus RN42 TaxID=1160509 RepID=A0A3N4HK14_ASCIM|nr:hypothetical protein BJ508DRAFT_419547 [Ascobolus immersus RN42]
MKLQPPSLLSLLLMPCALTSAIPHWPSTSPNPNLTKRAYNFQNWSLQASSYRFYMPPGIPETCAVTTRVARDRYIPWPFRGGEHKVRLCTFQNQLPEGLCTVEETMALDQSVNDCPSTLDEMVERLMKTTAEDGWDPALTEEEVRKGLMELVPEAFEEEVGDVPSAAPVEDDAGDELDAPEDGLVPDEPGYTEILPGLVQKGVKEGCKRWELARDGDSCSSIAKRAGIRTRRFYRLNPSVNKGGECKELWVGYAYCVERGRKGKGRL